MTTEQKNIIKNTWSTIATMDDQAVGTLFYNRLFLIAPEVQPMFSKPVPEQSKKLMAMLHYMVRNIDQPGEISTTVSALARRNAGYHVKPYQFAVVGNALLWTLERGLSNAWNEEAENAWATFYTQVSKAMISALSVKEAVA